MDNTYVPIIGIMGVGIYTIRYVIINNQIEFLWNIVKKIFIGTYKYSINFLTPIFLFVYYSESILNKNLYIHKITVKSLICNPQNATELILGIIYLLVLPVATLIWVEKVLNLTRGYILQVNFENNFVARVIRIFFLMLFLTFMIFLLMPLFIFGLLGNYGL